MAAPSDAAAQLAAAIAAEVARPKELVDVIGFVALNGYTVEASPCTWLSRGFYGDRALTVAVVNLQHGRRKGTRLIQAAYKGRLLRVQWLLSCGANVNVCTAFGTTASSFAYDGKHEAVARLLVQQPAFVSAANLRTMAWLGMSEAVVDVIRDASGIPSYTVLYAVLAACDGGHRDTAVAILAARPDVDVNATWADGCGNNTLNFATQSHSVSAVSLFLNLPGVNPHAITDGYTALHFACKGDPDRRRELLPMFLPAPAAVLNSQANFDRTTALMHVSRMGYADTLAVLLAQPGIAVNAADRRGTTALMHAAWNGHTSCVAALLSVPGIDIAAVNIDGLTVLQIAQHEVASPQSCLNAGEQQALAECVTLLQATAASAAAS